MTVTLRLSDIAELISAPQWWRIESMRKLLGADSRVARLLGHDFGPNPKNPEYAFLAAGVGDVKRSFVWLRQSVLIAFDFVLLGRPKSWRLDSTGGLPDGRKLVSAELLPKTGGLLNIIQIAAALTPGEILSVDVAGVRLDNWVVAFHADSHRARSGVSFTAYGTGATRFLVTGLAPGVWEIWWNGWLEDSQAVVWPEAGALYFEGQPGSYFLRRLG